MQSSAACPSDRRHTSTASRSSSICWLPRAGSARPLACAGVVFETLFGLIGSCGLRVSEAVGLRDMDVDLEHGMLTLHRTKFGKWRQVPMHHSCTEALRRYRSMRDLSGESAQDEAAFFVGTRGQRRGMPLSTHGVNGSSPDCASNWAGATVALTSAHAYTT